MSAAVTVENLHKAYGNKEVLKGIDLQVKKGEIFALLGPNGAGKTTAFSCMEGLQSYDRGRVEIDGTCGIQLQSASLPAHIRADEAVALLSRWKKTAPDKKMLKDLGIDALRHRQYQHMSTGQKRRLHLALALVGTPDIVFLDEPTAGLDVEGQVALHSYLRTLKQQGTTILLASHDMAEVESLCDRLAVLNEGTVIFEGTVPELTARAGKQYHVQITTDAGTDTFRMQEIASELSRLLETYKEQGRDVKDIEIDRGSLEEHFLELVREEKK